MGSVNAIAQTTVSVRSLGRRYEIVTGSSISRTRTTVSTTPLGSRTAAELGTRPNVDEVQRSAFSVGPQEKITQATNDSLHARVGARYLPTAAIEEEIANKPQSQHGVVHTGNRQVVRNSDEDSLIARENN